MNGDNKITNGETASDVKETGSSTTINTEESTTAGTKDSTTAGTKDSTTADTDTIDNPEQLEKEMSGVEKFVKKRKEKRQNKKKAAFSRRIDLIAFITIIVFASYFKSSNFVGQNTPLLYYEDTAEVIKYEEIELRENSRDIPKNLKDMKYRITIMYYVGNDKHFKDLYFKKDPKYNVGDVIDLKVSTLNPDSFELLEKK